MTWSFAQEKRISPSLVYLFVASDTKFRTEEFCGFGKLT